MLLLWDSRLKERHTHTMIPEKKTRNSDCFFFFSKRLRGKKLSFQAVSFVFFLVLVIILFPEDNVSRVKVS